MSPAIFCPADCMSDAINKAGKCDKSIQYLMYEPTLFSCSYQHGCLLKELKFEATTKVLLQYNKHRQISQINRMHTRIFPPFFFLFQARLIAWFGPPFKILSLSVGRSFSFPLNSFSSPRRNILTLLPSPLLPLPSFLVLLHPRSSLLPPPPPPR